MKTVLNAVSILKNIYPNEYAKIHWHFVGDGSDREFLENESEKLALKQIRTYGQKPGRDMPYLFKSADVLLVILKNESIFSMTIPSKIQSYMASGRPILAALNGEGARIISESGGGLSAAAENPEAIVEKVLAFYRMSSAERNEMGEEGRRYFLTHFQQQLVVDKIENLFKSQVRAEI